MSNEISVTFNLQFEIPAGQEIKGVSVSFGEPIYSSPIWYCDEYGSPYVDHKGNQIELKAWPQYYIDDYGIIEIPSIEKYLREKENQRLIERDLQRQEQEIRVERQRREQERRRAMQAEADRAWSEVIHRQFLMQQYDKKIQKEANWKEEGF
jgi:hypothetical protein